ncbi:MAG: Gfo/Idh/MocA family oxidoreductase, partial [Gemmatimonadota bacterium]
TGFTARFSPVSLHIRELVRQGAIGEVRSLRLIYIWGAHGKYAAGPDGGRVEQARRAGRMEEGGPLVDCGVHDIDLARWWLGSEVTRWSAAGAWVDEYDAPDHVYLNMDHAGGAHTMVEISYSYGHTAAESVYHLSYDLIGTGGVIRYEMENERLEVRTDRGTEVRTFAAGKNFEGMYAAFARALGAGSSDELPTGEDGAAATRIARAATELVMAQRTCGRPRYRTRAKGE